MICCILTLSSYFMTNLEFTHKLMTVTEVQLIKVACFPFIWRVRSCMTCLEYEGHLHINMAN
jgi:hypothetical protein